MLTNNAVVSFPTKEITYLSVHEIKVNPNQPRKFFSLEAISELSNSIKEHGILVPLSIRYTKGAYELIAGERRLRASKMAGLEYIPCIIVEADNEQSHVLAIIENLQRENLNFIEEAVAYQSLIKDHGYTQDFLARKISKNQSTIANKLRLLKLEDTIKDAVLKNNLTERHARALLKLPDTNTRLEVLNKVINNNLNVSKTENLIDDYINKDKKATNTETQRNFKIKLKMKDIKIFLNQIKLAIDVLQKNGVTSSYEVQQNGSKYKIIIDVDLFQN